MAREGPPGREGYMAVDAQSYTRDYGIVHEKLNK